METKILNRVELKGLNIKILHKNSPILLFFNISQRTGLKVIQNVLCMCVYVYKYIFGLSIFIDVLKSNVQLNKKESVQGASTRKK